MSEVDYRPRSGWTSTARGGALMTSTDLHRLGWVDHYTGAPVTYGRMTVAAEAAALRSIRRHHVEVRGWSDYGYLVTFTQAGRVWDCRGISRVPAAHASSSNPRANWHGGAGLWLIGADEEPTPEIIAAAQDFRHRAWLPRWPMATGRLGHRDVPGAATACPGQPVARLLADGTLLLPPLEEDDMAWDEMLATPGWFDRWPASFPNRQARARTFVVSGYGQSRLAVDNTEKLIEGQAALLAAHEGLDTEAILARLDEHAAQAASHRERIEATLSALDGLPAAVAEELGDRDGQAVQEAVARALARVRVTVDAEGDGAP